ncbi:MAG: serine/threonine-protein phosphatase [Gammaproteobacteria bacterium]|nr:serine/threonine-protein phosphatase [Gammaproteobacteria bacterium]
MTASEPAFSWISSIRTDVGMVRKVNEDACLNRAEDGLWAVADGMGGHAAGDVASGRIIKELAAADASDGLSSTATDIERRLIRLNLELRELASSENMSTIGSTVAALLLAGKFGMCIWTGDSRVYRVRNGQIEQLSQDHAFVEDLVEKGILSREDAAGHPQSNLVTRAVGAQDHLKLDMEIFDLQDDDIFVLCSDGLDKELSEQEIAAATLSHAPDAISQELVNLALARGARDNVTVASVTVVAQQRQSATAGNPAADDEVKELQREADEDTGARTDFSRLACNTNPSPILDDEAVTVRRRDLPPGDTSKD